MSTPAPEFAPPWSRRRTWVHLRHPRGPEADPADDASPCAPSPPAPRWRTATLHPTRRTSCRRTLRPLDASEGAALPRLGSKRTSIGFEVVALRHLPIREEPFCFGLGEHRL